MMGYQAMQRWTIPKCQIVKKKRERNGPEVGEDLEREEAEERKP